MFAKRRGGGLVAGLIGALLAVLLAPAAARAQAGSGPTVIAPVQAHDIPSLRELAGKRVARPRLGPTSQIQILSPLAPQGGPAQSRTPTPDVIATLPLLTPNTNVAFGASGSPRLKIGGFNGLDQSQSGGFTPPDQGFAVATLPALHQTFAFEIINDALEIFNGAGGVLVGPQAAATFFHTGGTPCDPQVFFDPGTQRWFVSVIDDCSNINSLNLDFAVSKTSDPTGAYFRYTFNASPGIAGCPCFPDFPHVGFDAYGYYVATNNFPTSGANGFAAIYAFSKQGMINGTLTGAQFARPSDFTIQPSVPSASEPFVLDNGGTEYLLSSLLASTGANSIRVFALTHTSQLAGNPANVVLKTADVPVEAITLPVNSTQPNDNNCFFGSACSQVDASDGRLASAVVVSGGKLLTAVSSAAVDNNSLARDVIAWFAIQPTLTPVSFTASVFRQGFIVPPDGFSLSYPVFGIRNPGQGILSLAVFGTNAAALGGYGSAAVVPFLGYNPVGNIVITAKGIDINDDFSCPDQTGGSRPCRWGDYAAATVDPGTGTFWTATEYVKFNRNGNSDDQWGTFLTKAQ